MTKELNEHEVSVQALLETMEDTSVKLMLESISKEHTKTLRRYLEALVHANQMCRSMNSIVEREGKDTNWAAFRARLKDCLELQHKIMYPKTYQND